MTHRPNRPLTFELPAVAVERTAERVAELLADRGDHGHHDDDGWLNVESAARYIDAPVSRIYSWVRCEGSSGCRVSLEFSRDIGHSVPRDGGEGPAMDRGW
jgi:hypothetical protein